jgi:hypothetical protein
MRYFAKLSDEMGRACITNWEKWNAYRISVGKPEGRRSLGRPRRRWVDNIKMGIIDRMGGMDWIGLAQDRNQWRALVNTVMNLRVLHKRHSWRLLMKGSAP